MSRRTQRKPQANHDPPTRHDYSHNLGRAYALAVGEVLDMTELQRQYCRRAIEFLHRQSGRPWPVEKLAKVFGVSVDDIDAVLAGGSD